MDAAKLNLNPLTQIEPITIVLIALVFIATYFALRRVFVFPYLAVMEKRERLFEHADASRAQAEEIERGAAVDAQGILDGAAHEAEELRSACKDRCDEYRRGRVGEATTSAAKLLEEGRAQITSAREEQSVNLRSEVEDCVGIACGRLLGTREDEVVKSAVDRAIARRMG